MDLDEIQFKALDNIRVQKERVARASNKRVKHKSFEEGELVWKLHLPIGDKDPKFGKWYPIRRGPFIVYATQPNGEYLLKDLDGVLHECLINGKYVKSYVPYLWDVNGYQF